MKDAVIIGGGFYGAAIAIYLAKERQFKSVVLLERAPALLQRASYNNQARVHNGYHYPRSFTTAFRSRVNLPRFVQDYPQAVKRDFNKLHGSSNDFATKSARAWKWRRHRWSSCSNTI
jgi:L-2-hydroxyglutarate oxidase LhgO